MLKSKLLPVDLATTRDVMTNLVNPILLVIAEIQTWPIDLQSDRAVEFAGKVFGVTAEK